MKFPAVELVIPVAFSILVRKLILFEFFLIAVLQFVFLYRDMGFDPNPQNILQILKEQ